MSEAPAGIPGSPASSDRKLPHFPALDGARGLGLIFVLIGHAEIAWAEGAFVALSLFFTLSGFLITSLLLVERHNTGGVRLDNFWVRRARRLVPAIVVTFGLIAALIPAIDRPPKGLIGDALASSFWVANWRFVFEERTYADVFSSASPFQHFWSLAVEEQFYLLFPLLLLAILWRSKGIPRARLAVVVGGLTLASVVASFTIADPSSPYRAYYGTDVRAAEILIGVLLAIALCRRVTTRGSGLPRALSQVLGVVGLAGLTAAFFEFDEFDPRIFEGGLLAIACCTAMMITSAIDAGTVTQRVLSLRPLVYLGGISYGTYLYHWPIYLAVTERSTGLGTVPLLAVRLALTFALAVVSHRFVEQPIRRNGLPRRIGAPAWLNGAVAGIALVALASGEIAPVAADRGDTALGTLVTAGEPPTTDTSTTVATTAPPTTAASSSSQRRPVERPRTTDATVRRPAPSTTATTEAPRQEVPDAFYEDPEDAELPPVPPPSEVESKLRIAVIGDSVGADLGGGLEAWAEERTDVWVASFAISACPISRGGERRFSEGNPFPVDPACSWWEEDDNDRYKLLRAFAPHVIVLQDGLNEMLDRRAPGWDDFRRPGELPFDQWLRSEYLAAFERLAEPSGAKVIATNAICGDWERFEAFDSVSTPDLRIRSLNTTVYPRLGSKVVVADLFERVCPGGLYSSTVEGIEDGRRDGIHFSEEAAAALAKNWLGPLILDTAKSSSTSSTTLLP